jgi:hypothetical protein
MSDSWMPIQPRIDEPSNPTPSSKVPSSSVSTGYEQCCQLPSMSTNFRSIISAFDVTTVVFPKTPAEVAALIAQRNRELGVQRILFGSDAPTDESFAPKAAWAAFRTLPLTEAEFQTIAGNVPPYMR